MTNPIDRISHAESNIGYCPTCGQAIRWESPQDTWVCPRCGDLGHTEDLKDRPPK